MSQNYNLNVDKSAKTDEILYDKFPRADEYTDDHKYEYDIEIIKTHSAPDLIKKEFDEMGSSSKSKFCSNVSDPHLEWDIEKPGDSILKIEKNVTDMYEKSEDNDLNSLDNTLVNSLDNTLDIINFILNNGPELDIPSSSNANVGFLEQPNQQVIIKSEIESDLKNISLTPTKYCFGSTVTPVIMKREEYPQYELNKVVAQSIITPEQKVFKTLCTPISSKKHVNQFQKRTPSNNNAYQHIASPVAKYIHNLPVTPLVKDIRPTKPLPFINNDIDSHLQKKYNKENIVLPSVAYKSAKKIQVINVPDEEKLPQSPWIKKLTSTMPKPIILKHDARQVNLTKVPFEMSQEQSYADLPLCQADVSVCTKGSAFSRPK